MGESGKTTIGANKPTRERFKKTKIKMEYILEKDISEIDAINILVNHWNESPNKKTKKNIEKLMCSE